MKDSLDTQGAKAGIDDEAISALSHLSKEDKIKVLDYIKALIDFKKAHDSETR